MIFRALSQTEWLEFQDLKLYSPPDLHLEGFIHASGCEEDVIEVLNRRYAGVSEMLVVGIDETPLGETVKWEKAPDDSKPDRLFPHIYAPLPYSCVTNTFEIEYDSSSRAIAVALKPVLKTLYFYSVREKYGEFSNFSKHGIKLDGEFWATTEHYFQAMKFEDASYIEQVRLASTPKRAAELGRSRAQPLRKDWEAVKEEVMLRALRKKFESHPELTKLLLSTGDSEIVENAPGDFYWGCGKDGSGKNRLGILLMQVRQELS